MGGVSHRGKARGTALHQQRHRQAKEKRKRGSRKAMGNWRGIERRHRKHQEMENATKKLAQETKDLAQHRGQLERGQKRIEQKDQEREKEAETLKNNAGNWGIPKRCRRYSQGANSIGPKTERAESEGAAEEPSRQDKGNAIQRSTNGDARRRRNHQLGGGV